MIIENLSKVDSLIVYIAFSNEDIKKLLGDDFEKLKPTLEKLAKPEIPVEPEEEIPKINTSLTSYSPG